MEREIKEFVEAVGAIEPKPSDENYSLFKSIFNLIKKQLGNGVKNRFIIICR